MPNKKGLNLKKAETAFLKASSFEINTNLCILCLTVYSDRLDELYIVFLTNTVQVYSIYINSTYTSNFSYFFYSTKCGLKSINKAERVLTCY